MLSSSHLALPSLQVRMSGDSKINGGITGTIRLWHFPGQLTTSCMLWLMDWNSGLLCSTVTDLHCSAAISSRSQGGPQRAIQSNPQHRENSSLTVSLHVKSFGNITLLYPEFNTTTGLWCFVSFYPETIYHAPFWASYTRKEHTDALLLLKGSFPLLW